MTAEEIFLKAVEKKTAAERAAYLDGACGADAALRNEVDALIASDQEAGNFLEQPLFNGGGATIDHVAVSEQPGSMIGPYKLLEKIGEGGFGVVFMAEQQKAIVRKVALKIIKPGMDTKEVVARFEAERQALALMDHPHIARVLDAGATESGRPYFVMELVRGIPITDYCDQNSLAFRERLELFTSVCQAVQHAHQKGIIHRDVKPNNVLVTLHDGKPVVKVIDFGVAKAIDRRLTERTLFTRFAEMIGTPLYMSPEQAEMSGLDVDTRTDIYSLGVLLYELLTGSTPFDKERLGKAAYDEIRRIIREEEPPRPSTRVSTLGAKATAISGHRKTEPKKLSALLKGDLDWIVMKALEKDRTRRYDTAKDFGDDIQHYLSDQPVEAHAPSRLYRFQKLVRRYRVATATVAAIAATLIAATVFSSWMAVSESRARQEMQAAKEDAEQATRLVEAEKQRALMAVVDLETSLEIFAAALGAGESQRITSPDQAVSDMLDALVKRLDSDPVRNLYVEANVRYVIGVAYWNIQRQVAANTQFRRSLEARQKAVGGVDVKTAQTLSWVGLSDIGAGRPEDAERHLRECAAMWRTVGGGEASVGEAQALGDLARSLVGQGRAKEALEIAIGALSLAHKSVGKNHNITGWCAISVAECHGALGDTEKQVAHYREALSSFEGIGVIGEQWDMWHRLGQVYLGQGRLSDAKDAFSRTLQLSDGVGLMGLQRRHESTMALSDVFRRLQDWKSAEEIHQGFLVFVKGQLEEADDRVIEQRSALICALIAQGREDEAEAIRVDVLAAADPGTQWRLWMGIGNAHRMLGRMFDAEDAFNRALQLTADLGDQKLERQGQCAEALANVLSDLQDWRAVESVARRFLQSTNGQLDKNNGMVVSQRGNLWWALEHQGRISEAESARLELLLDVQQAVKDGKTVWWKLGDKMLLADLISATKKDETSLQEAIQILNEVETQTQVPDWLNGWYHIIRGRVQENLGQQQEAIQHARLAVEKSRDTDVFVQHYTCERLVHLLCDASQMQDAESVLRDTVAKWEKKFGGDHVITQYARTDLAELLMKLKRHVEAEELVKRAQTVLLAETRIPASQTQRLISLLADVCEAMGKPEQAAQWRTRLETSPAPQPVEIGSANAR